MVKQKVVLVTDAAGAAVVRTDYMAGHFEKVCVDYDAAAPAGTTVTLAIGDPAVNIIAIPAGNVDNCWYPRPDSNSPAGAARLYAAGGTNVPTYDFVAEPITITIAGGGNTLTHIVYVYVRQ